MKKMVLLGIVNKMIDDFKNNNEDVKYYIRYDNFTYEILPFFLKIDSLNGDCKFDCIVQSIVLNNEFYEPIFDYFGLSECLYADYFFRDSRHK